MRILIKYKWLFVLAMLLYGCTVGPDYRPQPMNLPSEWIDRPSPVTAGQIETDQALVEWWTSFDDPLLDEYVRQAVAANHDYRIARLQVRKVRAQRTIAGSGQYPQLGVAGTASTYRISENGVGATPSLARAGLAEVDGDLFELGFDALWEIDVFGRTRRLVEAADARVASTVASRRAVLLSVIGEVAVNYADLRGAQRRLAILDRNIDLQAQTLTFVSNQFNTGLGDELPVAQARGQLETTRSARHPLSAMVRTSAYRLAVLTGRQPAAVLEELLASGPLPVPSAMGPLGLPSELLLRRPDLHQAERDVAAATADVGVATADLFPKFNLLGSFGFESGEAGNLFNWSSRTYQLGPSIQMPLFQGGRLRAAIDAAQADAQIALTRYEQSVLRALEEVEGALVRYFETRQETERLSAAVRANDKSVELSQYLYKNGLTPFLTVLDAQRRLLVVEDRLVEAKTQMVKQMVGLYKALGGGWESFEAAPTSAAVVGSRWYSPRQPGISPVIVTETDS